MPYFYVSESDLLEELEDDALEKEAKERGLAFFSDMSFSELSDTLMQSADILRKHERRDLALRLDDLRKELP